MGCSGFNNTDPWKIAMFLESISPDLISWDARVKLEARVFLIFLGVRLFGVESFRCFFLITFWGHRLGQPCLTFHLSDIPTRIDRCDIRLYFGYGSGATSILDPLHQSASIPLARALVLLKLQTADPEKVTPRESCLTQYSSPVRYSSGWETPSIPYATGECSSRQYRLKKQLLLDQCWIYVYLMNNLNLAANRSWN